VAGIAAECRDEGALLLWRHDLVRPGQEACAAGLSVVLAEADSCHAPVAASQPIRRYRIGFFLRRTEPRSARDELFKFSG